MEIRIESCKGAVVVDSFEAAGEWLEEMQPEGVSVYVDDSEADLLDEVDIHALCDAGDAFDARRAAAALRRAHNAIERADTDV